MIRRLLPCPRRAAALATLLALGLAGGSLTPGTAAAQSGTTVICEATGNPSAPYVEIRVNNSDLGNYSAGEGDIIPAPASGCPGSAATAPTPTVTTSATTSISTSSSSSSSATRTATHHRHTSTSTTTSSSTATVAPAAVVQTSETSSSFTPELSPQAPALSTLPHTGGQVPLTIGLGLLALLGGALLRWAILRDRPRAARPRR